MQQVTNDGILYFQNYFSIAIIAAAYMGYRAYEAYKHDQNQQDKHHHEDDI